MTRKEAIQVLSQRPMIAPNKSNRQKMLKEAIDMAIEALSVANLKEKFESADAEQKSDAYKRGFDDCKRAYEIELARSADAVQGEWTHDGSMWENRWVCDKCGHKIFERQTNFCPNCGAKMEGGDDE